MYGMTVTMFAILVTAANMFFVFQSHVAVRLSWKLMLAVPCLLFLQPIIQAAVSIKAGVHRSTGIRMYDRAARDYLCNAKPAGTEGLKILESWGLEDDKDLCNDWKVVGAPDENEAGGGGGRGGGGWGNPCKPENAINIGEVELPIIGKVDLLPPHIERAIFTKMWTAVVSNLLETEIGVAGVRMKMTALDVEPPSTALVPSRDVGKFLRGRKGVRR